VRKVESGASEFPWRGSEGLPDLRRRRRRNDHWEQLADLWKWERRKDADDFVRLAIESDRTTHNAGIGIETAVPEVVTQEDDVVATELIFLGRKGSSQPGLNADQRKEVRGHAHRLQPFRLAHTREAHAQTADHGQVFNGPPAASPFLEVRQIDRCGAGRPADAEEFVDGGQSVRLLERE
jgi:hypothetical protein